MKRSVDSDSEDDGDYVPPANDHEGSSSESEGGSDVEETNPQSAVRTGKEKKDLSKVWQDFQASMPGPPTTTESQEVRLVKVVRKYRFAGEEHEETVEVPENSDDARKWPSYQGPAMTIAPAESNARTNAADETADSSIRTSTDSKAVSPPVPDIRPTASTSSATTTAPTSQTVPPKRKPGPRKPKTTLAPLPNAASKAKKITTLEKSAMDWSKHVTPGDKDELEAQRRGGGGYLDKVEFLNRVEERKESVLSENSGSKRRRL